MCLASSGTMCNCAREDIFVDFVDFNVIKLLFGEGMFFYAFWAGWMVLVKRRSFDVEETSVGRVWQNFVLSHVEVVGVDRLLPEDKGYEGDGNNQHVQQVEAVPTESVFVEDEAVGDDLQDQLDGEDGGEEVVKIVEDLQLRGISIKDFK